MNITNYIIAGIHIQMQHLHSISVTENFKPFLDEPSESKMIDEPLYVVNFSEVPSLPEIQGTFQVKEQEFSVVIDDEEKRFVRCFFDQTKKGQIYAMSWFSPERKEIQVDYLPCGKQFFKESGNSFFHIGWENVLIKEQRIILHAACIDTPLGGILFSGPSGIGKSTQADLWCKYTESKLLNGDRPILGKEDNRWYAYGSPYAGSSKCYVNDKCPIRAIVVLRKEGDCPIRRLKGIEAFKKIFSELIINSWDASFVTEASELARKLIMEIPVYEMVRVPNSSAIETLQNKIAEEGE